MTYRYGLWACVLSILISSLIFYYDIQPLLSQKKALKVQKEQWLLRSADDDKQSLASQARLRLTEMDPKAFENHLLSFFNGRSIHTKSGDSTAPMGTTIEATSGPPTTVRYF